MISSSNFFKKTLFTIDSDQRKGKEKSELYGPWAQENNEMTTRSLGKNRNARYISIDHTTDRHHQQPFSNLFSQHRSHSVKRQASDKRQDKSFKFPRVNEYDLTNKIKYCLNLDGNLNFINKSSKNSYKKMIFRQNYDFIKPRSELYRKCINAARQCVSQSTNPNEVFYNG